MIHNSTLQAESSDSPPLRRRPMGIDPESVVEVMDSMSTTLYAHPALAVVREYSTNARDAHIAAGHPLRPIEVTLPALFDQTLVVTDHGVGMSADELCDHYAFYGASSKRGTNAQVGRLGFGCKSAFAIADQFTVVATKDGRQVTALFSRSASDGGEVQILFECETDAPNGVTVRIPIPESLTGEVTKAARFFFSVWEPGTVLLDGQDPARLHGRGYTCGPVVLLNREEAKEVFEGHNQANQYVLMGDILYPADLTGINVDGVLIFRADIGQVHFPPSRERVRESSTTKNFIDRTLTNWRNQLRDDAQQGMGQAATAFEVALLANRYRWPLEVAGITDQVTYTFAGVEVPAIVQLAVPRYQASVYRKDADRIARLPAYWRQNYREVIERTRDYYPLTHPKLLVVTGTDDDPRGRRAALPLARAHGYQEFLFPHGPADLAGLSWLADGDPQTTVMTSADAARMAAELRRTRTMASARSEVVYTVHTPDTDSARLTGPRLAEQGVPVTCRHSAGAARTLAKLARQFEVPLSVVVIEGNFTAAALQRRCPEMFAQHPAAEERLIGLAVPTLGDPRARGRAEGVLAQATALVRAVSKPIAVELAARSAQIDDPIFREVVEASAREDVAPGSSWSDLNLAFGNRFEAFNKWMAAKNRAYKRVPGLLASYPLLSNRYNPSRTKKQTAELAEHILTYVNAVHATTLTAEGCAA